MEGTIKKLIAHRGFGFIQVDDSDGEDDIFFHRSQVEGYFEDLSEGTKVKFDVEDTPKGPQAVDVTTV